MNAWAYLHILGQPNTVLPGGTGSFANDTTGLQTINSLALTVGVGTEAQRAAAGAAVIADVAGRGYALSVGAIGARVLLDTLSDLGAEGHGP
jgi:hypothetical protein